MGFSSTPTHPSSYQNKQFNPGKPAQHKQQQGASTLAQTTPATSLTGSRVRAPCLVPYTGHGSYSPVAQEPAGRTVATPPEGAQTGKAETKRVLGAQTLHPSSSHLAHVGPLLGGFAHTKDARAARLLCQTLSTLSTLTRNSHQPSRPPSQQRAVCLTSQAQHATTAPPKASRH